VGTFAQLEGSLRKPDLARSSRATASANDQLLARVQGGLDRSYRLAGLMLGNAEDARDATQDAVMRAWRSSQSLQDPARFDAWFDRILVNACRDQLRRRRRVRFIPLPDAAQDTSDPFRAVLDSDEAFRAISRLDDDLRLVLILHYWAGLALEEVASRSGWPVGTVKSRLHRALETLRGQSVTDPRRSDR
jgi:RNA polymerase sigma-70 factor (ECF subfamily)